MMVMESRRNSRESAWVSGLRTTSPGATRTEDEPLGRSQHVQWNGDLVLVLLALHPLQQVRRLVGDGRDQQQGEGGERHGGWVEHVDRGRHFGPDGPRRQWS